MVRVHMNMLKQKKNMKVNGKMEKKMEMENLYLHKVIIMKALLNKVVKVVLVESNINQEQNLMVIF